METVLLVIHLMIAVAMVGVVLMQQSEGGALGMGGGSGGGGGFLTGRGTANVLTRTTAALAGAFFLTSITLTVMARRADVASPFDSSLTPGATTTTSTPAATPDGAKPDAPGTAEKPADSGPSVLDALESGQGRNAIPSVPQSR